MPRVPKVAPKGRKDRGKFNAVDKELIYQTYVITGNKNETARRCKVSLRSVYNVLQEYTSEELQDARNAAIADMASRVQKKAIMAIDSINQADLDNSTPMQKATIAGILSDKTVLLDRHLREREQIEETAKAALPAPDDLPRLLAGIQNRIQSLTALHIQVSPQVKELTSRAEELQTKVPAVLEAQAVQLDDFDGVDNG